MKSHFWYSNIMNHLLSKTPLLIHLIIILVTCLSSQVVQPLCHADESTALLEFKDSFITSRNASDDPLAYPKVASWSLKEKHDCCLWDGVDCDENNTHVIALHLNASCLYGSINSSSSLFRLSHLQFLDLSYNDFKGSQIPSQLGYLRQLIYLNLSSSSFAGQIPSEISQLSHLSYLDMSYNTELELKRSNLTTFLRNFTSLKHLDLSQVDISSSIPSNFLENFTNLTFLSLEECQLSGEFPNAIFQLPSLQTLSLSHNRNLTGSLPNFFCPDSPLRVLWLPGTSFSGQIPSSIGNLTSLNEFSVAACLFSGTLPSSLGRLSNLHSLSLSWNHFSGFVDFNMFLNMEKLTRLLISGNNLTMLMKTTSNINTTLHKFKVLSLSDRNLTSFPDFLRYQDKLEMLDLGANHLNGNIPNWIWNSSTELEAIMVGDNILTGFAVDVLPSSSLRVLIADSNNLSALPVPPPSIVYIDVSNNKLSVDISPLFCNLSFLEFLDVSHNKFSGELPDCSRYKNLKRSSGRTHPQVCPYGNQIQAMILSSNKLQGRLPRSLANCVELAVLDLENNQLNDVFPSWLGVLPKLKLLLLRFNNLNGEITRNPIAVSEFSNLHIIDLAHNNFTGPLPSYYFRKWNAMRSFDVEIFSYLNYEFILWLPEGYGIAYRYRYSVSMTIKGKDMQYKVIPNVFTVVDLSSNKFQGGIPECIGNLQGLQVLNLANNMLTGSIPSSISHLMHLESLDLSQNKLSGKIPQQLEQLTFLAYFNVSFNHLSGPIPQGNQFSTFGSSSYEGNEGLWGYPLQSLNTPRTPPLPSGSDHDKGDQDSRSWFELNWFTLLPGFVGGLLFGVAIEQFLAMDKCEWFVKAVDVVVATKTKWKEARRSNIQLEVTTTIVMLVI